ncbi:N-acetylmuramoyl-L-alanine amidase [Microbacteriaceae bacterium 4G12]
MNQWKKIGVASCLTLTGAAVLSNTVSAATMKVTDNLNVRERPTTNSTIIGKLSKNTTVDVKNIQNGWGEITYNGKKAFISSQYLQTSQTQSPSLQGTYKATENSIRVRMQPSLNSSIIGYLNQGQAVTVLNSQNDSWYQIEYNGRTAYVSKAYITNNTNQTNSSNAVTPTASNYRVTGNMVRVRSQSNTNGAIIGYVYQNQALQVLARESNGWYKIVLDGKTGYISGDYVSQAGTIAEPMSHPLTNSTSSSVLRNRTIIIDAGHGGKDSGSPGYRGLQEKNITLEIARKLRDKLANSGVHVIMTRDTDAYITLSNRVAISSKAAGDAFLSIHLNSSGSSSTSGIETYYNRNSSSASIKSRRLAECMQGVLTNDLGARNRGVKDADYQVIKQTKTTSILVETGFITNSTEANKLASAAYQEKVADTLYKGFIQYFKEQGSTY